MPGTGVITSVNDAASSTTLLEANPMRKMALVFNNSTEILYIALADTTASATNFSCKVGAGELYEFPTTKDGQTYSGKVVGIWANNSTGAAIITEIL